MPEGSFELALYAAKIHQCCIPPRNDIDINGWKPLSATSEDFPDIALYPVTDYRAADLFTDRNTETGFSQLICLPDNKKTLGIELVGGVKESRELNPFPKSR